jgi:hypothetical protein
LNFAQAPIRRVSQRRLNDEKFGKTFAGNLTMSSGWQVANVIDLSAYRTHRNQRKETVHADNATRGALVFAAVPVMIPMIAWVPVWGMVDVARSGGTVDE